MCHLQVIVSWKSMFGLSLLCLSRVVANVFKEDQVMGIFKLMCLSVLHKTLFCA